MRIDNSNQSLILQKGLGTNASLTAKNLFSDIKTKPTENSQLTNSQPLPPCTRVLNNNLISNIPKSTVPCRYEDTETLHARGLEETMARWDWMDDNLFRKFGINGKVTGMRVQTIPQHFTIFHIETNNPNDKNKVIIQIGNGEFMVGGVPKGVDLNDLFNFINMFLEFNENRLSDSEMRRIFEDYLLEILDGNIPVMR